MRIVYPYNEVLPKRAAHDVYIVQNCAALAVAGCQVTLLCGRGSLPPSELYRHYGIGPVGYYPTPGNIGQSNLAAEANSAAINTLPKIEPLPIVRKGNGYRFSWNFPFFFACQRTFRRLQPQVVITSVLKQAGHHIRRRLPGVAYVYEAHGLAGYPGQSLAQKQASIACERDVLARMDLVTVTTAALKHILQQPPYALSNRIDIIPLAVRADPLPPPRPHPVPLTVSYVGQLYPNQGVALLLEALARVPEVQCQVYGGKNPDIEKFQKQCHALGIDSRVHWHGFHPPARLREMVADSDVFVAPFLSVDQMPYVAHTKLLEYTRWGRPIIAPDLPVVREHFIDGENAVLFRAGDAQSLADALRRVADETLRARLYTGLQRLAPRFTWEARTKIYLQALHELGS